MSDFALLPRGALDRLDTGFAAAAARCVLFGISMARLLVSTRPGRAEVCSQ